MDRAGRIENLLTMQYKTLGNTGLIVSRLSFGAMTFTAGDKNFATVYKTEEAGANAMVGPGPEEPPRGGDPRDEGGISHRARAGAGGTEPPAYLLVHRSKPEATGYGL